MSEPGFTPDEQENEEDPVCALGHVLKKGSMPISLFQRVRMSCCYPPEIKRAKLSLSFKASGFPPESSFSYDTDLRVVTCHN